MGKENKCELCGEPMPEGEGMFKYHGYSGPCQKKPMLQPHELRVVIEKKDLDEKRQKLTDFMRDDVYSKLGAVDQGLLMVQLVAMNNYSDALERRIELFSRDNDINA